MKTNIFAMKVFVPAFLFFSFFVSDNVFGKADRNINKTFNVQPGGRLALETDHGSIKVNSSGGDAVTVDITFRRKRGSQNRFHDILEDFDVEMRQNGQDVSVRVEHERNPSKFWKSVGKYLEIEFIITVPKKYDLDLSTAGGSVSIGDLEGEVLCSTSGGKLAFSRIKGAIVGRTSGGSITLDACDGDVDVKTSGGKVRIGKVSGDIVAHTSGGRIEVDEVMGSIRAKTSGGSVKARISRQPEDDCTLVTSGGNITVYLEPDIQVNLDAGVSGGRVKTDIPVVTVMKGDIDSHSLRGAINGGGPELYLHTSGGNIYINAL
jgi:DUF4097 and DUF4098 domain-containing protein YvlB